MELLTLLIVGLVAGLLASALVSGGGYGVAGDVAIGIVGAVIGNWLFRTLGLAAPVGGLGGTIVVALIGSIVFLILLRVVRRGLRGVA